MNIISKLLTVALVLACSSVSSMGQGTVGFANNPVVPVIDGRTGLPAEASGNIQVGLYYSADLGATPNPGANPDSFLLAATTPIITLGVFNNGGRPVVIPGLPGGSTILVQIRAWSNSYSSFEDAVSNGNASDVAGVSNLLNPIMLAGPRGPACNLFICAGLLSFTVSSVPEPSTIALSLVGGLGALMVFRRRR